MTGSAKQSRGRTRRSVTGLLRRSAPKKKQTDKLLILFNVMDEPPPSVLFHPRGSAKGRCGTRNDEELLSNNTSAAARYRRVRSAGAADRRGGGEALRESGAPAAHRFRRESSPSNRHRIRARAAAVRADRCHCVPSGACRRECPRSGS